VVTARRALAGAGAAAAACFAALMGCALIAGVQDGVLAPDGGGGSGTSGPSGSTSSGSTSSGSTSASSGSASSGSTQFNLVQAKNAGNVQTATAMTTAQVGAGNLLVAAVYWDVTAASLTSVGDSLGNTWHQALAQTHLKTPCTASSIVQIWYAENVHGGMDTVTVTFTQGGDYLDFYLLEYSGVATTGALDAQGGQIAMNATNMVSVDLTTTHQDLIVGIFADTTGVHMTPGTGYEAVGQDTYFSALVVDNLTGSAGPGVGPGAHVVSEMLGGSDACWAASAVAFRGP
jgi:hypothetical protein